MIFQNSFSFKYKNIAKKNYDFIIHCTYIFIFYWHLLFENMLSLNMLKQYLNKISSDYMIIFCTFLEYFILYSKVITNLRHTICPSYAYFVK